MIKICVEESLTQFVVFAHFFSIFCLFGGWVGGKFEKKGEAMWSTIVDDGPYSNQP